MTSLYFEDFDIGKIFVAGTIVVDINEMKSFARRYDPQPFHTDEEAARASIYGTLTAPAAYTMAISHIFLHRYLPGMAWIGLLGWENVEFPNPVRPGDELSVTFESLHRRESTSKKDRGIVSYKVIVHNQNNDIVLAYKAKAMAAKRPR